MRILHVLDHSLPLQSGYVYRTLGLLRAQRSFGWETAHLTPPRHEASHPSKGALVETVDGWTFHRTASPGLVGPLPVARELVEMAATERRIAALVKELRPDILHAHSPVLTALPALRAARRFGLPVVYEVRGFWEDAAVDHGTARPGGWRYKATQAFETRMLRQVDGVFTLCANMRDAIVERGIDPDKVVVIPNAVDIDRFAETPPRDAALASELGLDGAAVLGFVGSFYHYEGLDLLIAAMPEIAARVPQAKVLLVGGGPEDERLRRLAAESPLGDRIVFTGRVPHDRVDRYYGLVDVAVYPRRPMRLTDLVTPLKPLESMAQRRLVLASDVGGHRELIEDGVTGYLFAANDPKALAQRVADILAAGSAEKASVLDAGRHYVERERTWRASAERYRPVYEWLTGPSRRAVLRRAG